MRTVTVNGDIICNDMKWIYDRIGTSSLPLLRKTRNASMERTELYLTEKEISMWEISEMAPSIGSLSMRTEA